MYGIRDPDGRGTQRICFETDCRYAGKRKTYARVLPRPCRRSTRRAREPVQERAMRKLEESLAVGQNLARNVQTEATGTDSRSSWPATRSTRLIKHGGIAYRASCSWSTAQQPGSPDAARVPGLQAPRTRDASSPSFTSSSSSNPRACDPVAMRLHRHHPAESIPSSRDGSDWTRSWKSASGFDRAVVPAVRLAPVEYNPLLMFIETTFDAHHHRRVPPLRYTTCGGRCLEYFDGFLIGLTALPPLSADVSDSSSSNIVMEYDHEQAQWSTVVNVDFDTYS